MRHALETTIATIAVPGAAVGLIPRLILARTGGKRRGGPLALVACGGLAAGLALVVWVSVAFVRRGKGTPVPIDPPREFVATGPFRYTRNPMYGGALLAILSEALLYRSGWLLAYAAALWAILHTFLVLLEEPQLARRFGEAYRQYKRAVPRWIPKLSHGLGGRAGKA